MSIPRSDCPDQEAVDWLKQGRHHRLVMNARRAKKLRDRGEQIKWNDFHGGWLWIKNQAE